MRVPALLRPVFMGTHTAEQVGRRCLHCGFYGREYRTLIRHVARTGHRHFIPACPVEPGASRLPPGLEAMRHACP